MAVEWFWAGMRKTVAHYVQQCMVCQRNKHSQQAPRGLLQPLPVPERIFDDLSMDFVEVLPPSKGRNAVLVVVEDK